MIEAIILSIILHAQIALPVLGSTQGSTAAPTVTNYRPIVLEVGKPLVLRVGTPVVIR
jgi:3-keto-L-gulonate-6-phosphate decarboxylase